MQYKVILLITVSPGEGATVLLSEPAAGDEAGNSDAMAEEKAQAGASTEVFTTTVASGGAVEMGDADDKSVDSLSSESEERFVETPRRYQLSLPPPPYSGYQ